MLGGLILLYGVAAGVQAATKLLWGDELITFYIATQPRVRAVWEALKLGTDPNPPLTHLMVRLSTGVVGDSALAIRVPAVACGLLAVVCLWLLLRRWVTPVFAAAGVLAFMATRGFDYAYDARSYGALMGFAMASLLLWFWGSESSGWRRGVAYTGMALALAAGLSSNYYGVLAFFPIGVGELVREVRQRRAEPWVWMAMVVASLPLMAYLPLIRHSIAQFGPHAWNRPRLGMVTDSYVELVEGVFWPVSALAAWALWRWWKGGESAASGVMRAHEATAIGVLVGYPVLGYLVAVAGAGMVSPRCVVPVCCGFGLAAGVLGYALLGRSGRGGVWMLLCGLIWVVAREAVCFGVLQEQRRAFFALRERVEAESGGGPVLVGDSLVVLPLGFYSGEELRARLFFPVDFAAIHRAEPDDSGEQNLWAGRERVFPVRIVGYEELAGAGREALVVARPDGWLAGNLRRDGWRVDGGADDPMWQELGGVFTPLAHEQTRLLHASR